MFKPNLIPNSKTEKPIVLRDLIKDLKDYIITFKKDGCRGELIDCFVKTRALKPCGSDWIQERYNDLTIACHRLGIVLEGEFYAHGWKFNEIVRVFKSSDITDPKKLAKFKKMEANGTLAKEWPGRTPEWLCTYHPDEFKLWLFDCFIKEDTSAPYEIRLAYIFSLFSEGGPLHEFNDLVQLPEVFNFWEEDGSTTDTATVVDFDELYALYESALDDEWEGLVLANKSATYKHGRSTAKACEFFKMKDDKNEYDGKIIRVEESTVAADWAEKTVNELGRSVTSKLQEDRLPSGMAKAFVCEYEGHEIKVSFQGFCHEQLKEIWDTRHEFPGQWIKYTGMKPVKNVPRHAHFKCYRDEK